MKHKKIWLSIFISFVFLIMPACGSAETPTTPTFTATPLPPTATPSPTVTTIPSIGISTTKVSPKDGMVMVYVPAVLLLVQVTVVPTLMVLKAGSNLKPLMLICTSLPEVAWVGKAVADASVAAGRRVPRHSKERALCCPQRRLPALPSRRPRVSGVGVPHLGLSAAKLYL